MLKLLMEKEVQIPFFFSLRASEPADLQFWGTLFFDPSFFGLNQ